MLAEAVAFVAGVQAHPFPRPILSTRVVLVTGSHAGGLVAGAAPDPRNAVPLQQLAAAAGSGIVTLEWQPASAAIEFEDAITPEQMDTALRAGWAEAERAADEGIEMLILAAGGAGASSAAVAVISAISGYEATALLGRVVTPAGCLRRQRLDDPLPGTSRRDAPRPPSRRRPTHGAFRARRCRHRRRDRPTARRREPTTPRHDRRPGRRGGGDARQRLRPVSSALAAAAGRGPQRRGDRGRRGARAAAVAGPLPRPGRRCHVAVSAADAADGAHPGRCR